MRPIPGWIESDPKIKTLLETRSALWLVTGAAGFIGSHLVEVLLTSGQRVRGLDNFATGYPRNLEEVGRIVGEQAWRRFEFVEADIRDRPAVAAAVEGVDHLLHQAALGSVPRSLIDPLTTHDVNATGFMNILYAARVAGVESLVYAASSSTYGDEPNLPKVEDRIGNPLSPYALTKAFNEAAAGVFERSFGIRSIGLRYFNVFGPRQDPDGAYAAVIPRWVDAMIMDRPVTIHGDGETSRDFCYVANAVQANIRAALGRAEVRGAVYNVAVGDQTSLNQLFALIRNRLRELGSNYEREPVYTDFRAGDVRHSLADISKARRLLDYMPTHRLEAGIAEAMPWYQNSLKNR